MARPLVNLHLPAFTGKPFCGREPAEDVELRPDHVLCNEVILPWERWNDHLRLYVIGAEYGAICAVWGDSEQDAFDVAADSGLLLALEDVEPRNWERRTQLGEDCKMFNLETAWIRPAKLRPDKDVQLLCSFAEARGAGHSNLGELL